MAVLNVRKYGDPVLRRRADAVGPITPEIRRTVEDMIETMYDEVGIGLAAPQVGIPLRLMVVTDDESRAARALVNPAIVEGTGQVTAEEGCLSIPGIFAEVSRAAQVTVTARDLDGQPVTHQGRRAPGPRAPARDRPSGRHPVHRPPRSPRRATASSARSRRRASPKTPVLTPSPSDVRCSPASMRVLFYGTPEFALPTLEALLRHHEVVGVVTQPDRPAHRGQRLTPPPVKVRASAAGLPILQPPRLRDPGWAERLHAFRPDVAVVVAFGQILPKSVLDVPARGSINVHASLLPRYRGAAPVAWAIMRGERVTGITTFQMDEGMDTGPVLLDRRPSRSGTTRRPASWRPGWPSSEPTCSSRRWRAWTRSARNLSRTRRPRWPRA